VFLDPYGMQVEWSTIEALAATKAVDLWYLFPLGVGVARLLTHSGEIDEGWQNQLDWFLGFRTGGRSFTKWKPRWICLGGESETVRRTDAFSDLGYSFPCIGGRIPICWRRLITSFSDHFSASFPSAIRWIVIDVIFMSLPVLGAPGRSPSCLP
jgi:hypothetical protein